MAAALIALGSNLGDRERILNDAVAQLALQPNVVVLATSRWRATKPIGGPKGQAEFLNGAVLLGTSLSPEQLHVVLRQFEATAGRKRVERWAPRTLDIDLLLYDKLVIDTPELAVPHPRMAFRRFVLEPAAEAAGWMEHPTIGWTITKLRDHVLNQPGYFVAIAGPIGAGKTAVAKAAVPAQLKARIATIKVTVQGRLISDPATLDCSELSSTAAAGGAFADGIELLESRAAALSMAGWPALSSAAISDYWLDQSLCWAESTLPADELKQYVDRYFELASNVLIPRLLVSLDVTPEVSWQRITDREGPRPRWLTVDWLARYRELLLARIAKPGHGPVLRLDGTRLDEAREELVAAIQAMQ